MQVPTGTGNNAASAGLNCILRLTDPDIGQFEAGQLITSILFTGNGCFITVREKRGKRILALHHYEFGLADFDIYSATGYERYREAFMTIFRSDELQATSPENLVLSYYSTRNTIVPGAFFNTQTAEHCFRLNYSLISSEVLRYDYLRAIDAYNVYGIPPVITNLVLELFPSIVLRNTASYMISSMLPLVRETPGRIMLLNVNRSTLSIFVFTSDTLLFYNNFEVHSAEDVVYYSVFVAGQLNIKDEVKVWLSGDIGNGSDTHHLLLTYLRDIDFVPMPEDVTLASALQGLSWSKYFIPFILTLCES